MPREFPRVTSVEIVGAYQLAVNFVDNTEQRIDLGSMLEGPHYGPLRDPEVFNAVAIDDDLLVVVSTMLLMLGQDRMYRTAFRPPPTPPG